MTPNEFYESDKFVALRESLIERYSENHRYYHNMWHIESMLQLSSAHAANKGIVSLAIWYHDAIYDPTRKDNEEKSAELAIKDLSPYLSEEDMEYLTNAILFTKHHFSSNILTSDLAVLVDCDLYILSHDWYYTGYAAAIRKEYAHVSDEDYIKGRCDFLKKMLARPTIYSVFRNRNAKAKMNMQSEFARLKAKLNE